VGKRLFYWELAGFLLTAAVGAGLHFLYAWSGGNTVAAAFSAVNESVWEHMKLLVVPLFFFTVVQVCFLGTFHPNLLAVRGFATLLGALLIPTLYYTYTGALGLENLWADLVIFIAADAVVWLLDVRLLRRGSFSAGWQQVLGLLLLWGLLFSFVWCTFRPPQLPLWRDPVTGQFGIPS
jgi:hypothetical protein